MKERQALHLRVNRFSFWITKLSEFDLPPQRSVDHLTDGYVRGLWEDMFSSCKESDGKSLAGHLLKDGNGLEEAMDSTQAGLHAWIRVRVWVFGPFLGFDPFGPSE